VEKAAADKDHVQVTVWRGQSEQTLDVATAEPSRNGRRSLVEWAGRDPAGASHRAMMCSGEIAPVGVYVGYFSYGSPADAYGLILGRRIMEVDGSGHSGSGHISQKTVTGRPDRSSVRLKTITWNNAPEVINAQLDKHYWPAYELTHTTQGAGCGAHSSKAIPTSARRDNRQLPYLTVVTHVMLPTTRGCGAPAARIRLIYGSCRQSYPGRDRERRAGVARGELGHFRRGTVYGLGANGPDPAAVNRIFEAKDVRRIIR